jgi:hypothetical protein
MPFSFAVSACLDHAAQPVHAPAPRFYSTDLLPAMQDHLVAVADAETRYEIQREQIEQGSVSEEDKECRLAKLRAAHEQGRGHRQLGRVLAGQAGTGRWPAWHPWPSHPTPVTAFRPRLSATPCSSTFAFP